ncbi:MAG: B12-binding domain-containing radical SAM protein [Pirellulaceae bacterium]
MIRLPTDNEFHPDSQLNCLLVQPKFEELNYWNFLEGARSIGAKAAAPPLGLLTVAAILPQHWNFKLVDLNVEPLTDEHLEWADLVCTGGMLPQQGGILEIVERANQLGLFTVVGGPDPTSQPDLYESAKAIVTGEGEASIPVWLRSWRAGKPNGIFGADRTVDVSKSPVPKFELVSFDDYLHVGLQTSRGCPYNCEFCDIIELYGRKPRVKTPEQFTSELQRLKDLGYRGWIDIADDNFIGNRQKIKPVLINAAEWMKENRFPFIFSTEASVNLADDEELLELMRACDFRYVFCGIETPDPEVLAQTQKRINTVKPLQERIQRIYEAGISVTAGFIIGFDSERDDVHKTLIPFIEESGIMMAMVGLLYALPNTQLTRRLKKEGRMISDMGEWIPSGDQDYRVHVSKGVDHMVAGLNFVTQRDRIDIYRDLKKVVETIYSPRVFLDRVLSTTGRIKLRSKHVPNWWELKRMVRGFRHVSWQLLKNRETRWLYLRNAWKTMWMGPEKFEFAHTIMGGYLHFQKTTANMLEELENSIQFAEQDATYPRSVSEMPAESRPKVKLPVASATPSPAEK